MIKKIVIGVLLFFFAGAFFHAGMIWREHRLSTVMFDENLRITINQGETVFGLKTVHIQVLEIVPDGY